MYRSPSFFRIDRHNNFVIIKDLTIATIKMHHESNKYSDAKNSIEIEISINKKDFKEIRSGLEKILYGIKYINTIPAKVVGSDPDIKELNNKKAIITESSDDHNWLITDPNLLGYYLRYYLGYHDPNYLPNLKYYNPNLRYYDLNYLPKFPSITLQIDLSDLLSHKYRNVPYL